MNNIDKIKQQIKDEVYNFDITRGTGSALQSGVVDSTYSRASIE